MATDAGRRGVEGALPYLLLLAITVAVFGSAFGFDFVQWDDPVNVTQNPLITEPWSKELVARLFTGEAALRFKPLPWLIARATHAAWGFNPAAWHAVGLSLHALATLTLAFLLRRWLVNFTAAGAVASAWLACGAAALWAVHPARAEPAVWITAMPYPLMGALLFVSFHCYTVAQTTGRDQAGKWFLLSWAFALGSHFTYPVGVTYVLWLMAADRWIFRTAPKTGAPGRELAGWWLRHATFALPAALSLLVTWQSAAAVSPLYPASPGLAEVGIFVRLKMAAAMLAAVPAHLVWPVGLTPNNPMVAASQIDGLVITLMSVIACAAVLGAWLVRRRWPAVAGLVLGVATLCVPVLGLTQWPSWSVADRHVYLPHAILVGAAASVVARWVYSAPAGRRRGWMVPGVILLIGVVAWRGHTQASIWRDTDTLFTYIEQQPAFNWDARQLAHIYSIWAGHDQLQGRIEESQHRLKQAHRALVDRMLSALAAGENLAFLECAADLERRFGLPPQLRRERAKVNLQQGATNAALRELEIVARALPDDSETQALLRNARKSP
jgi:hypothetical protein